MNIASTAAITIATPTIHVFVIDEAVWGQMNAEMNSHAPSAMFTQRAHVVSPIGDVVRDS
jgi:hypothetical protein